MWVCAITGYNKIMDTTKRMKLSEFAKLNDLNYRTALVLFKKGEIKGIQTASGTIRVEGWAEPESS